MLIKRLLKRTITLKSKKNVRACVYLILHISSTAHSGYAASNQVWGPIQSPGSLKFCKLCSVGYQPKSRILCNNKPVKSQTFQVTFFLSVGDVLWLESLGRGGKTTLAVQK